MTKKPTKRTAPKKVNTRGRGPDKKPRKRRTVDNPKSKRGAARIKAEARELQEQEEALLFVELRKRGLSHQLIAEAATHKNEEEGKKLPPVKDTHVRTVIARELKRRREELAESVEDLRALEMERLDELYAIAQQRIAQGSVATIDTALKIMSRRAKLSGLDAPVKLEPHSEMPVFILPTGVDFTGTEFDLAARKAEE